MKNFHQDKLGIIKTASELNLLSKNLTKNHPQTRPMSPNSIFGKKLQKENLLDFSSNEQTNFKRIFISRIIKKSKNCF